MALLNSPLKEEIDNLIAQSNIEYDNGNLVESVDLLEIAWDKLPDPKGIYDDSFHIVLYLSETYLEIGNINNAKKWADLIYECDLERADSGQREFLSGKVAFESGDLICAKQYFSVANEKSQGRCFKSSDGKYLRFFKSK
jgi:hypothetical protein